LFNGFSLHEDVDSLFRIGKEILFEPVFPKDEMERVRRSSIAILKSAEKGTGWKTSIFLFSNVYKNHPYGWMAGGTPESLKRITQADLFAMHKKYIRPEQTKLIVLSDFSTKELKKLLNKEFGHWKNSTPFTYRSFPPVPPTRGRMVKAFPMPGKKQVDVKMGFAWVAKSDPNYDALDVLNDILGGSTLTSRLGVTIRDKMGLTYGITTKTRTREKGGIWFLSAKTEPEHVQKLIQESLKIIDDVRQHGITEEELRKTQSFDLRILPMIVETPGDILNLVTDMVRYNQPLNYFDTYYDRIMRLKVEQINRLARNYLHTKNYVLTVAGDVPADVLDGFR
jgi:zinc protease